MRKKIRVIVLMGGKSPEYEVSLVSGREVVMHLSADKYEVLPVIVSRDGRQWQLKGTKELLLLINREVASAKDLAPTKEEISPDKIPQRADVVFIAMHGTFGEDGTVQGLLELAGIPYTGAGVLASAIGMDKIMFRKVMKAEGINLPRYVVLKKQEKVEKIWERLKLPVVVKPSAQGSSVGVSLVFKRIELKKALEKAFNYGPEVIIDEYLPGIEVTCGVLGNGRPMALPVVEIIPKNRFFDYEAKYTVGKSEEIVPARISRQLTKTVQDLALKVYRSIGCQGMGRVDMIVCKGKPYVLEINTIPGLTPNSLLPKEATAFGISYSELLNRLIDLALEK